MHGKAQSAMEYLMTYGWAILVIAVVIGILYQLGVFSSSSFTSTACIPQSGFYCQNLELNTTGYLSFDLGQTINSTLTITGVGCSNDTVQPSSFTAPNPTVFLSGQPQQVAVKCPGVSGLGSSFKGYIWIEYSISGQSGLVSQVATITAVAATSASVGPTLPPPPPMLYVSNYESSDITVINTQTNMVTNTIMLPAGSYPYGEVVSPDGKDLYVTNNPDGEIYEISTANDTVVKTISGLSFCINNLQISSNGLVLYGIATGCNPASLDVINTDTDSVTPYTLPTIGGEDSYSDFVKSPTNSSVLYYSMYASNIVVTFPNNALLASPDVCGSEFCQPIAVSANGQTIYTAPELGEPALLYYVSTSGYSVSATADLSQGLPCSGTLIFEEPESIAVSPDGSNIYVSEFYLCSSGSQYAIQTVDMATHTVSNTIALGSTSTSKILLSPSGQTLYVISEPTSNVIAISTATHTIEANITVGSYPYWLAVG